MSENAQNIHELNLPDTAREIVRVLGLAAATRLLERCGGRRVYVPKTLRDDHPLTLLVGRAAATRLIEHFQLSTIDVPKHDTLVRALRDNEIRERRAAGATPKQLAEEYWLSERHIRNICCEPQ